METRRKLCRDEKAVVASEPEKEAAANGSVERHEGGLEELESEEHETAEGAAEEGAADGQKTGEDKTAGVTVEEGADGGGNEG